MKKNTIKYFALAALLLVLPLGGSLNAASVSASESAATAGISTSGIECVGSYASVGESAFTADIPTSGSAVQEENCTDCIVSSVLDKLPAENPQDLDALMEKLTTAGAEGVQALVELLAPPEEGENAPYEYALNSLTAYVSAPGREDLAAMVKKALFESMDECEGDSNRAFVLSLTRLLVGPKDVKTVAAYLSDDYLKPTALSVLITMPDIDSEVLSLIKGSKAPDAALAYLAAAKGITGAEKYLLKWLPSDDGLVSENVYQALGKCGSTKSIETLRSAAEADGYALGTTDATASYFKLLERLALSGDARGLAEVRAQMNSEYVHVRVNALDILLRADQAGREGLILDALKDGDREYRCAALFEAGAFADENLYAAIAELYPSLGTEAKTDIVTWLGERKAVSQTALVLSEIPSAGAEGVMVAVPFAESELASAAIRAAGRLGGDEALKAIASCLGGPHSEEAVTALASFSGDVRGVVAGILYSGPEAALSYALYLAGHRHVTESASKVLELTGSANAKVSAAAYGALVGTCGSGEFDALCDLLDNCPEENVAAVQAAAVGAARGVEYARVSARMEASPAAERYYPLLADNASEEALTTLVGAAREGSEQAFGSLLKVDADLTDALLELGSLNPDWTDRAASRACDLIAQYAAQDAAGQSVAGDAAQAVAGQSATGDVAQSAAGDAAQNAAGQDATGNTIGDATGDAAGQNAAELYVRALELQPSAKVTNKILNAIGDSSDRSGIGIALPYADNPETAEAAAYVIKNVAYKNPELLGDDAVRAALQKAREIYSALAASDADAGYAVDEIDGLLAK